METEPDMTLEHLQRMIDRLKNTQSEDRPPSYVPPPELKVHDRVMKSTGDYCFYGVVVAVFAKRDGKQRYVVENDDGVLHIFSRQNLELDLP